MAFPAALEALKYSHRAHGFFLLAIAIISTLFHSLQMDVMRDAREAYCSCCAGVRKRRINRNEEKPTDDKATHTDDTEGTAEESLGTRLRECCVHGTKWR